MLQALAVVSQVGAPAAGPADAQGSGLPCLLAFTWDKKAHLDLLGFLKSIL